MSELFKIGQVAPGPMPAPQPKKPSGWSTFGKALGGAALLGGGAYLGRGMLRRARYAASPYVRKSKQIKDVATKAPDMSALQSRAHGFVPGSSKRRTRRLGRC